MPTIGLMQHDCFLLCATGHLCVGKGHQQHMSKVPMMQIDDQCMQGTHRIPKSCLYTIGISSFGIFYNVMRLSKQVICTRHVTWCYFLIHVGTITSHSFPYPYKCALPLIMWTITKHDHSPYLCHYEFFSYQCTQTLIAQQRETLY